MCRWGKRTSASGERVGGYLSFIVRSQKGEGREEMTRRLNVPGVYYLEDISWVLIWEAIPEPSPDRVPTVLQVIG
jgi:hypothetical protein